MTTARPRPALLAHASSPCPPRPAHAGAARRFLGVAFLALLAQVRFEVGPVPITGQTLGVLLLAAAGGRASASPRSSPTSRSALAGLPVFAGGGGGLATSAALTAGYLVGFVVAAALVGAWPSASAPRDRSRRSPAPCSSAPGHLRLRRGLVGASRPTWHRLRVGRLAVRDRRPAQGRGRHRAAAARDAARWRGGAE
jgi:hypothetical protein